MIFAFDFTENILRPLSQWGGFFLLLLGIIWIIYALYETKRRGSFKKRKVETWDFDVTKFLKILTYFGFIVGVFSILSGVGELILDVPPSTAYAGLNPTAGKSIFTAIILIVFGIFTFLKPINDLPIASVIGLLVASLIVAIIALAIPQKLVESIAVFVDPRILLVVIFIIIFAFVALTAKFYMSVVIAISKALSWPPLAFIVAAFCLIQGFLLLVVGVSISGYF
ncbi:hypothetical protein LCGC14_0468190 [marine sediment metagenome]|uniref:Uncharacterized protein n=1 Tax=marine sediment metagenome TaxID=412755 RepID=A0A0F9SW02_9ZZZZ|nr:MAG: hypothetical protein Lokiarch_20930 [Candidatus Lokiarchaeum sp. GC14_75]